MEKKALTFKVKGMLRDTDISNLNTEYSFENKNLRIAVREDHTLLGLTNEKGTSAVAFQYDLDSTFAGTMIGYCVLNSMVTVFFHDEASITNKDTIFLLTFTSDHITRKVLYQGNLNFNVQYPIETIGIYETENIQKVYWIDGLNQPRVINIMSEQTASYIDTSFDFAPTLQLKEVVNVERVDTSNGSFPAGVIQYSFSYYNKYGQESAIFYTSPLYYTSEIDRGVAADSTCTSCFKLRITKADTNFDYIRVYSMMHTSLDTTPIVKKVTDIKINKSSDSILYTIIDDGIIGESVDSTKLLYTGSQNISAETFTHKDNTLFLGNIKLQTKVIPANVRDLITTEKWSLEYGYKYWNKGTDIVRRDNSLAEDVSGYYNYSNQLRYNSEQITTFKFMEYYRFGLQFQYNDGSWSEVLYLKDLQNTLNVNGTSTVAEAGNNDYRLTGASMFITQNMVEAFITAGFKKVRPVIVYPTIYDRECLCQGILCPTVYNYEDRYNNTPFVQSSWFGRAQAPYDFSHSISDTLEHSDILDRDSNTAISPYFNSRMAILINDFYTGVAGHHYVINNGVLTQEYDSGIISNSAKDGSVIEFRHNYPLSGRMYFGSNIYKGDYLFDRGGEVQQWYQRLTTSAEREPYLGLTAYATKETFDIGVKALIAKAGERFAVDQSILTFHSPDLEFDPYLSTINLSKYKLRIVGHVPMTSFVSDVDIQTSTAANIRNVSPSPESFSKYKVAMPGFRKYNVGVNGISRYGYRGLSSGIFWLDDLSAYNEDEYSNPDSICGFNIYPWQRNGSLNNRGASKDGTKTAMLKYKKMSNLRFSYNSRYFSAADIWYAEIAGNDTHTGVSDIQLFDSDEVAVVKLKAPKYSQLKTINYYGNIDKILSTRNHLQITASEDTIAPFDKVDVVGYDIATSAFLYKYHEDRRINGVINRLGIYEDPFYSDTGLVTVDTINGWTEVPYKQVSQVYGTDPISMKYKSTKHAVIVLNYAKDGTQIYAPTFRDGDISSGNTWAVNLAGLSGARVFWDFDTTSSATDVIEFDTSYTSQLSNNGLGPEYGFYWLAELYNDNVTNRFGGDTTEDILRNTWLPCGEPVEVALNTYTDPFGTQYYGMYVNWTEGDTYYQRYDHLKTYPFTLTDQNSVTDIISFMCETRVNIDGRYDRNRGQLSNLVMTPTNFNLLNMAYSQKNNYFTYSTLDYEKFSENNFPTTLCWSQEKSYGEDVDTWTNVQLSSSDVLDGDKGSINALRAFNNEIYAFQDTGISNILFNSRVQIPTTDTTPIEITNGLKYSGKKYFTSNTGCVNKWSIIQTSGSVYFIDNNGSSMYTISGDGLKCVTDLKGFKKWMSDNNSMTKWNPSTMTNFRAFYDKSNNDIYFINGSTCLVYNEMLDCFTSFMSYEGVPCLFNELGDTYLYRDGRMWLMGGGNYNTFFNVIQPFYITYRVNPNTGTSVIFDNVEYQADSFNTNGILVNSNFTQLDIWNEYQNATTQLATTFNHPSNLKDKFRIWRAILPRYGKDRIRNPWVNIKLSMNNDKNINKFILHSFTSMFYL